MRASNQEHRRLFWLPDLCTPGSILLLVLVGILVALVFALASVPGPDAFVLNFGMSLLFIEWIVLISAALLCGLRRLSQRLGPLVVAGLTVAVIPLVTLFASGLVVGFVRAESAPAGWFLIRNVLISLLASLMLLRYLVLHNQWRQQVAATVDIISACVGEGEPGSQALASHVQTSLSQVGYHEDEAAVIAQRLTATTDDNEDPASRTELAMKLKARVRLGEDKVHAEKPQLPARTAAEQARYEQLRVLPFGCWMEFNTNQQGDLARRRLSWYSRITDNALFVNQRGQRVAEYSLDQLARMMARGQARLVTAERGRLVDRAWQATISALRSFAGRGDQAAATGSGT